MWSHPLFFSMGAEQADRGHLFVVFSIKERLAASTVAVEDDEPGIAVDGVSVVENRCSRSMPCGVKTKLATEAETISGHEWQ